jgi:hypothetical protein
MQVILPAFVAYPQPLHAVLRSRPLLQFDPRFLARNQHPDVSGMCLAAGPYIGLERQPHRRGRPCGKAAAKGVLVHPQVTVQALKT